MAANTINFTGTGGIIEGNLGDAIINVNTDAVLDFDKTDDYITCADDSSTIDDIFDGGGTFSAWINPASDGENDYGMIALKRNIGSSLGWNFTLNDDSGDTTGIYFYQFTSGDDGKWKTTSRDITFNVWTHVAVTFDNSHVDNVPIIYINGVAKTVANSGLTEQNNPSAVGATDAAQTLLIGGEAGAYTWEQYIADVRMYDAILTQAEIQVLASKINGDSSLGAGVGALKGWWKLNEGTGTSAADSSANSNTGTLTNGPAWVFDAFSVNVHDNTTVTTGDVTVTQGKLEGLSLSSVDFDGVDEYIQMDSGVAQVSSLTTGTISAWVKTDNTAGGSQKIVSSSDASDAASDIMLGLTSDNPAKLSAFVRDGGSMDWNGSSTTTFTNGVWYHVAFTVDGTGNKLFINGVQETATYTSGNASSTEFFDDVTDLDTLRIGNRQDSGGQEYHFDGNIRDVRIYDYALSNDQMASLYSGSYNVTPAHWWKIDEGTGATATIEDYGTGTDADGTGVGLTWANGTLDLGTLTIASNGTYSATSGTTTITDRIPGDKSLENNGTFTHNKGTVLFNAVGDQLLQMAGTGNLYNFTINKSDSDVAFVGNHTFENNLDVTMAADHTARSNNAPETVTVYGNTYLTTGKLGESTQWTGTNSWGMLTVNSGEFILSTGTNNFTGIRNVGGTISQS